MIVIDASITLCWVIADEARPETDSLYREVAGNGVMAPLLWKLEIANALRTAVRKRRISLSDRDEALALLMRMNIILDASTGERGWTSIVTLSDKHDLTPYDAAYLDLALREHLPLASLDKDLVRAARAEGVDVLP